MDVLWCWTVAVVLDGCYGVLSCGAPDIQLSPPENVSEQRGVVERCVIPGQRHNSLLINDTNKFCLLPFLPGVLTVTKCFALTFVLMFVSTFELMF